MSQLSWEKKFFRSYQPKDKNELTIVICGHVDHGKSTLTGQLTKTLKQIKSDDYRKIVINAKEKLEFTTDTLPEE